MRILIVIVCLALCSTDVLCDYRLEVQLIQYVNPTGILANGECCDQTSSPGATTCHPVDACDVQFLFTVTNFRSAMTFHSETKGVGQYDNTNLIDFSNCAELESTSSTVVTNPLTFFIPSAQWTGEDELRVVADIRDLDPPVGNSGRILQEIGSPFLSITRPSMPSETFTEDTITQNGATITLRYRVICSDGTCGNECSSTANCQSWTPACTNIDQPTTAPPVTDATSPTNPCFPDPCENEGLCEIFLSSFRCRCVEGYVGDMCESRVTSSLPTDSTTFPDMTSASSSDVSSSSTTQDLGTGTDGAAYSGGQWVLILLACVVVIAMTVWM